MCLLWQPLCFHTVFKYSEVAVILPFDMWANATVNFSQHETAGAVAFRRAYRWESQQVMTLASFFHFQPYF